MSKLQVEEAITSLMNDCKEMNRKFQETIELQIGVKKYYKRFSGESRFLSISLPNSDITPLLQIPSKLKELQIRVGSWVSKAHQGRQNPMLQIQSKLKELQIGFESWVPKQPLYIMAAVSTVHVAAAFGAHTGLILQSVREAVASFGRLYRNPLFIKFMHSGIMMGLVMHGTSTGIATVMMRLKGKEDMQSCMMAAFGAGAMLALVMGMGSHCPHQVLLACMVANGSLFALIRGATYHGYLGGIRHEDPTPTKTVILDHTQSNSTRTSYVPGVVSTFQSQLEDEKKAREDDMRQMREEVVKAREDEMKKMREELENFKRELFQSSQCKL